MARHVVRSKAEADKVPEGAKLADGTLVDAASMPGGASGIPDYPNQKSTLIHGIDDIAPARPQLDAERMREPRKFRVTGGPEQVMYDGQRVRMLHGKIYTENSVDLDLLRKQGVQLQEVTSESAA